MTTRRDFLQLCATLGATVPFFSLVAACEDGGGPLTDLEVNFSGKVLVIGAGAAGLAAGYALDRYGIDFEILEASSQIGGRVRRQEGLGDFPVDLGAEWIHQHPSVLARLVDDPKVDASIDVLPYSPDTVYSAKNGKLIRANYGSAFYSEYKFKRTTWFGFLESFIAADIGDRIHLDTPVTEIDRSGDQVVVRGANGEVHVADRVLVTVPMTILQRGDIAFIPELSAARTKALDQVDMPGGFKVFFEFEEKFYPDICLVGGLLSDDGRQKIFYDAAFRKDAKRHVLALFCVGEQAEPFVKLEDDEAIAQAVLDELDELFDGDASKHHIQHVVQNWSAEPFVGGAYTYDVGDDRNLELLKTPLDNRVFFAGEAYSNWNGASVPGAMQSAYTAIRWILAD